MIIEGPIDLGAVMESSLPDCGGTAIFVGRVRDHNEGRSVARLYYECYRSMAEKKISQIETETARDCCARSVMITHRVGWLEVGEAAVAIVAHGAHRSEAFAACRAAIDRVKSEVPIWKQEVYADGTRLWVICQHESGHTKGDGSHGTQGHAHGLL